MKPQRVFAMLAVAAALNSGMLAVSLAAASRRSPLVITFLDVGQGDAAVVQTPAGHVMLIDTGGIHPEGDNEGRRTVAPFLRYRGIWRTDVMILTHPHLDHIGGAALVLSQFPDRVVIDDSVDESLPQVQQIRREAASDNAAYLTAAPGEQIDFGDGVVAHILGPTALEEMGTPNNASVVVRLTYGRTAVLFMGDAEAPEEQELLASGQALGCNVLKVGHHGSKTSSTPELLARAHPQVAVISVGAHNRYGHPSPSVVRRLNQDGIRVYRTDINGAVRCTSDGATITATPMQRSPHA
ncbi:MAG: MBL fold metallo-hydrolase [Armatimonadetes bacterium]|nr:MBL fold metallo-hydrolase [Armatimonadota bacterium]MDE2208039.1 MBL fold metallo-hydrolase [Armatimonadota bacterium]